MEMKFDVAVVGAGVAGLYSSIVLASKGWKVALIESKPRERIGDKTCGDAIGVHHLERIGLRLPDHVIDHRYKGVKIYSPSEEYEIIVPGEGVSVNRIAMGQWLLKEAEDRGVELLDQHVVQDVELKDGVVRSLKVKRVGGGSFNISAKAFIDASGAKPALRSKLPEDWPISERPHTTDFNIAYREVIELEEPIEGEDVNYAVIYLNTEIAPGGYWWLFPKSGDGSVVNVGLGVIWNGKYNPRHNYVKYLKARFRGRVLHAGGGIVPTRRPLPTLVWRNVGVVGDAAYTVNPIHGGGIGSSLEAAHIVGTHLGNALESGEVDEARTWGANYDYLKSYGTKQASLDVLRMYMQLLRNDDFEWIMKSGLVDGLSVYDLGVRGELTDRAVSRIAGALKFLAKPSLLKDLVTVRSYMKRVAELYSSEYPKSPAELRAWMDEVERVYSEYARKIGFDRGELVKW